jgi:protein-disulfide isomerase
MFLSRRILLTAPLLAAPLLAAMSRPSFAALSQRSVGSADAPVTITEFYSLTCPHCARFARDSMPQIHEELIKPGKLRMVFRDFPLDQIALAAALVARALPPERYEPFISALLASQDRWLYARGVNSMAELAKMAALAGMSRAMFDAVTTDKAAGNAILADQADAEKTLGVDSTPTFIINGPKAHDRKEAGERSFSEFARFVTEAT